MQTTQAEATEAAPGFTIQPAAADSLAYVLKTWGRILENKLEARPQLGFLKAFAPIQAKIIRRSRVLCAMRGDRIAGFVVYELDISAPNGVLHWICTRETERQNGAAAQLLAAAHLVKPLITSWTSDLRHLGLADAPYTPFWLRS